MIKSKQIVACIALYSKLTYLINNRRAANIFYYITNVELMYVTISCVITIVDFGR